MKSLVIILTTSLLSLTAAAQPGKKYTPYISPEQKLNDIYCSGLFQSTEGTILDVASQVNISAFTNILDWMQGRVAGLQVYSSRYGTPTPVIRGGVPAIFVDELQVSASFLNTLNVNDVAIVKVIKTPFFGGFNGGNGAIAIYTLGGEEEEE